MTRCILRALTRISLTAAAALTLASLVLGLGEPQRPPARIASPSSYQAFGTAVTGRHRNGASLLDVEHARLESLDLPAWMGLDLASVSPWEEDGGRQIVGVAWKRSGTGGATMRNEFGLVRMTLDGKEILNRLEFQDADGPSFPAGPPCWNPDRSDRVAYAGADGRIYLAELDPVRSDAYSRALRPLSWVAPSLDADDVMIRDLAWPAEPQFGGRLLAALCFKRRDNGRFTDCQIWWLLPDPSLTSIVDAGRLLQPACEPDPGDRRQPKFIVEVEGVPTLAYYASLRERPGHQLRLAPIRFDGESDAPSSRESESRALADGCLAVPLPVARDGRSVVVVRGDGPDLEIERVAIERDPSDIEGATPRLAGPRPLASGESG